MTAEVLHAGFDGLKVTLETDIPPATREKLHEAKQQAIATNRDVIVNFDGFEMAVRRTGGSAFSAHTGEYGAEFYLLDPENRPKHNPGVIVDFRAFLLATEGLDGARSEFERAMAALGIDYAEPQMRVSRVDFAVDILAPWFEPESDAIILPARTRKRAFEERDTRERYFANTAVTGITAGQVSNRQLTIYDKRAEVIEKRKPGWKVIWDQARAASGKPPLDLGDRDKSSVWRFEARMGSKCLRRRFEIRCWFDLDAMIGDVYADFGEQFRYVVPLADKNRNRWPLHELWRAVTA